MSRKMEKQTADDILLITLQRLGIADTPASKQLLREAKKPNVTSDLLGAIANALGIVALKTQRDIVAHIKSMPS